MIKILATTPVALQLFPNARPKPSTNKSSVAIYQVDMHKDAINDVLANWGRKQKVKVENFEGRFNNIKEVFVNGRTVLAAMNNYVYTLSTVGVDALINAMDLAAAVAEVADEFAHLEGGRNGLFSRITIPIKEDEPTGKGVKTWLEQNPHMVRKISVTVEPTEVIITF